MKHHKIHTWFFLGNGIGSFLCALHAVETVWFSLSQESRGKCIILVTRDERVFRDLIAMYPHITVLRISFKNFIELASLFFLTIRDVHYVFHPVSFGEHHFFFKLYSKWITLWNRKSENAGAVKNTWGNRFFFSKIVERDLTISIFNMVERLASSVLEIKKKRIDLLFQYDLSLRQQFASPYIVIHPFAASVSRSLPKDRWIQIIEFIHDSFPQIKIVISGGPGDFSAYKDMVATTRVSTQFIQDFANGSIQKMIQIISGATLFVGVDTGITHIANILHRECVVIGNRSNPCWLPTYNDRAVILTNSKNCTCKGNKTGGCFVNIEGVRYYRCMLDIEQETIYSTITSLLHSTNN